MDAPEQDFDIKLQKISGDLIGAFDKALIPFLRKSDGDGSSHARSTVRYRDFRTLTAVYLDPFQDLPQLLDPYLPEWLPVIVETFLELLQRNRRHQVLTTSQRAGLLMSMPMAICKMLYTLCKVRGEKVIVGFLSVETRYLEPLLSALQESEAPRPAGVAYVNWMWEERYIVLLWLSQLFLAPFDLATISSVDIDDEDVPVIPGLQWPSNVPGIAVRVLPLAIKHLSAPGKERDAAKSLLVRIAMRRDMQEIGILDAIVRWALFSLRPKKDEPIQSPYHYIGLLSLLAGLLISSSDSSDLDQYLAPIFHTTHAITTEQGPMYQSIVSSALARKMVIKVVRSITTQVLRKPAQDMADTELVETTIQFLLECLADNDTPVRFAASKALSIVTLKLDPELASQVIDTVLDSLNKNVLWVKNTADATAPRTRDLTSVDPLEWHGLMLTLSHLLYRRSPPAENLSDIIHALLLGLSFERRSTSGGSVGTNVRDAACFGIWALSRRYTTKELLAVPTKSISVSNSRLTGVSIQQLVATELVVSASLDPAGNIRRGSSAALQELIGRHPDTVEKGIWVVQTVDYHAVALRSRAISEVALNATKLSPQYGNAMIDALLGWRGIGDADAASRRVAGAAFGAVMAQLAGDNTADRLAPFVDTVDLVTKRLKGLQPRQVEELHGLLLSLAAVFDAFPALAGAEPTTGRSPPVSTLKAAVMKGVSALQTVLETCQNTEFRRPELVAEAASKLVVSSLPLLQAAVLGPESTVILLPGGQLISGSKAFSDTVTAIDTKLAEGRGIPSGLVSLIQSNLNDWLTRPEDEVIAAASEAALVLLVFGEPVDRGERKSRENTIRGWAQTVRNPPNSRTGTGFGFFRALTMAHPILPHIPSGTDEDNAVICSAILARWASDKRIETRVALLKALTQSEVLEQNVSQFLDLIAEGLDDYTTNARGDYGSLVRLEAIRATKSLWRSVDGASPAQQQQHQDIASRLFPRVLRLAAEKLDRVRVEAQVAVGLALQASHAKQFGYQTFSSRAYFRYLLSLLTNDHLHPAISAAAKSDADRWMDELLAGFVTSADTGDEKLVIASRAALTDYCDRAPDHLARVCAALLRNLRSRQGTDRVVVSTLEVVAFLAHAGLLARCPAAAVDYKSLCLQVQRAGYRTGNVRKLEACVRAYGAVAGLPGAEAGRGEARRRLGALLFHPWPRVRSLVVDELWGLLAGEDAGAAGRLKGVDWGRADKAQVRALVEELGLG